MSILENSKDSFTTIRGQRKMRNLSDNEFLKWIVEKNTSMRNSLITT